MFTVCILAGDGPAIAESSEELSNRVEKATNQEPLASAGDDSNIGPRGKKRTFALGFEIGGPFLFYYNFEHEKYSFKGAGLFATGNAFWNVNYKFGGGFFLSVTDIEPFFEQYRGFVIYPDYDLTSEWNHAGPGFSLIGGINIQFLRTRFTPTLGLGMGLHWYGFYMMYFIPFQIFHVSPGVEYSLNYKISLFLEISCTNGFLEDSWEDKFY